MQARLDRAAGDLEQLRSRLPATLSRLEQYADGPSAARFEPGRRSPGVGTSKVESAALASGDPAERARRRYERALVELVEVTAELRQISQVVARR